MLAEGEKCGARGSPCTHPSAWRMPWRTPVVPPLVLGCLAVTNACDRHKGGRHLAQFAQKRGAEDAVVRTAPVQRDYSGARIVFEGCTESSRQRIHSCTGAEGKLVWPRGLVEHWRPHGGQRTHGLAAVCSDRLVRPTARAPKRRLRATAAEVRRTGVSGWNCNTSAGMGSRGCGGRLAGSVKAARVASSPGASSAEVNTWRARESSPWRVRAQAASRRRSATASASRLAAGRGGIGCRPGRGSRSARSRKERGPQALFVVLEAHQNC